MSALALVKTMLIAAVVFTFLATVSTITYRITDTGHAALHLAAISGSSARSRRGPEEQLVEFRVLDYLAEREGAREESLRNATRVSKPLLAGMVRKKWIAREDVSAARDATRTVKVAVLVGAEVSPRLEGSKARPNRGSGRKLNDSQRALIDALAAAGGKVPVETLRGLDVPRTALGTLVRRGLIELHDERYSKLVIEVLDPPATVAAINKAL